MEKNWVAIYKSKHLHKIEIMKGLLADNNIEAVVVNKQDSSYLFGEIELYVKSGDVIKAKYLIK